jgi:signal peptidase I
MTKNVKKPFDPEVRRLQYLWGGAAMFALGLAFCLLNALLPVIEYQKVSDFTAFFFVVGGGLGIIAGAEKSKNAWKIITPVVLAAFGIALWDLLRGDAPDPTSLLLVVALAGAYFLFLYFIKLSPTNPESRSKNIETAEVLIVAIALAIGIKAVGVQAFKIPSGSMLHSLEVGDHLLISKFLYGIPLPYTDARLPGIRDPQRGDIVVFAYPGFDNLDRPSNARIGYPDQLKEQDFIKRIIGLPGEMIEVRNKRIYINGQQLDDKWGQFLDENGRPYSEPYAWNPRDAMPDYGPAAIPPGMYFVMGDNRNHSNDSRAWGFVRKGRIKGKAVIIYWSWPELKRIGTIIG